MLKIKIIKIIVRAIYSSRDWQPEQLNFVGGAMDTILKATISFSYESRRHRIGLDIIRSLYKIEKSGISKEYYNGGMKFS